MGAYGPCPMLLPDDAFRYLRDRAQGYSLDVDFCCLPSYLYCLLGTIIGLLQRYLRHLFTDFKGPYKLLLTSNAGQALGRLLPQGSECLRRLLWEMFNWDIESETGLMELLDSMGEPSRDFNRKKKQTKLNRRSGDF